MEKWNRQVSMFVSNDENGAINSKHRLADIVTEPRKAIDHWYFWCPYILGPHFWKDQLFRTNLLTLTNEALVGDDHKKTLTHYNWWFSCCRTAGHWKHSQAGAEKNFFRVHSWATCRWLPGWVGSRPSGAKLSRPAPPSFPITHHPLVRDTNTNTAFQNWHHSHIKIRQR